MPKVFGDLFEWLGAPRVAERRRLRQLGHLRAALGAQVDLGSLDRTVDAVKEMVEEIRPVVTEGRQEIRDEARRRVESKGRAAIDAAGMWGHAQHVNEPMGPTWGGIARAVAIGVCLGAVDGRQSFERHASGFYPTRASPAEVTRRRSIPTGRRYLTGLRAPHRIEWRCCDTAQLRTATTVNGT